MPMTEDLTVFFNEAEHATKAVLDNVAVTGIFDNGYTGAMAGLAAATEPSYLLPTADAKRAVEGSPLRIVDGIHAGLRFTVRTVEPDGTGLSTLQLQRTTHA